MKKPTSIHGRYLIQETLLILVLSYLMLFASTHNGLVSLEVLRVTAYLTSAIVLAWIAFGQTRPGRVEWAALGFLAVMLLTCFTSIDPRRSLVEFWLVGMAFLWFLLVLDLVKRGWPGELFIKTLLIIGTIVMGLAWVEVINWYRQWVAASGEWLPQLAFRLSVPNFFGVLLNVLLMVALARLSAARGWTSRILLGIWSLSALALIYLSSSRGGWLGTAAGLACLAFLLVRMHRERVTTALAYFRQHTRVLMPVLGFTGLVVLSAAGYLLYRQAIQPTHDALLSSRSYLWGPAWGAFLQSPLLGRGPYTFVSYYMRANSVPPNMLFVYAHSIYLDLLSGSGLLGLLAYLILSWIVIRQLWHRLDRTTGLEQAGVIGVLAALAAFGVHGFVDSVHHTIPTSAWIVAVLTGAGLGQLPESQVLRLDPHSWQRLSPAAGLGVLLAGLAWLNVWMLGPLEQGVFEAETGNWQGALPLLESAVQRDPHMAITHQQLGLAESVLASNGSAGALDGAIREYQQVVKIDPDWALNYANLGALYHQKGDLAGSVSAFEHAVKAAPQAALYWLNLGEVYEQGGQSAKAAQAYQQVLLYHADWAQVEFWNSSDLRKQSLAAWRMEHPETIFTTTQLEAQAASTAATAPIELQLAGAYLQQNRLKDAERLIQLSQLAYSHSNLDALERIWLQADLAAQRGSLAQAVQLGQQAISAYQQEGMEGPGTYGRTDYAELQFRRPAMTMEMVPQMGRVGMTMVWQERTTQLKIWKDREQ